MSSFGVTNDGFVKKTLSDILSEIESSQRANISQALNQQADSVLGQVNGIFADATREAWDVMQAVYGAQYPDSANGASLDDLGALTGAFRLPATQSTVDIYCTGNTGTSLLSGRTVTSGAQDSFESTADATLAAATAWTGTTGYNLDDIVSNDSNIYICTDDGTSAGSGGPTGTGTGITDGTCEWDFVGDGIAYAVVAYQSVEFGAIVANAGAIDTENGLGAIETPVSGWSDAKNLEDAEIGREVETDPAFRVRREELLRISGSGTVDAIRADLLALDDVQQASVFENVTDVTDGDGVPPHAFEAVVLGGTDGDIWQQIWNSKPAGIASHGTEVGAATDSLGASQTVKFTRPTEKAVYFIIDVDTNTDPAEGPVYPTDGDDQVKAALVAYGNTLEVGDDVIAERFKAEAFTVDGVTDITDFKLGFAPTPTGTVNLSIDSRELATFDTSDVTVNS
jgi:uncharacterized phage protein gp47/JayE